MTNTEKRKLEKLIETRLIDVIANLKTEDLEEAKNVIIQEVKDLIDSEVVERG
jgi:hypothetical protein